VVQKKINDAWVDMRTEKGIVNSLFIKDSYSWIDKFATPGQNFYRLKLVGVDGKAGYSKILLANVDIQEISLSIYPNPVKDKAVVTWGKPVINGNISLFNASGIKIWDKNISPVTNETIDFTSLNKGPYFLFLTDGNNVLAKTKFMKSQ
jgi:hypothetical protein